MTALQIIASLVSIICLFVLPSGSAFISADGVHKKIKHHQIMSLFPSTSKYHPNQDGLKQRRRWLVVDFDGTCTETDTTPLLPRLAASYATRQRLLSDCEGEDNIDNTMHQQDLERRLLTFQQLEDTYMELLADAKSSLSNNEKTNHQSIHDALHSLDEPSIKVTNMVSESRVLEGLGRADSSELREMLQLNDNDQGEERIAVRLRQGCESTLARILIHHKAEEESASCLGWSLAVLSINWSPTLIDAVLTQQVLKKRRSTLQIESCETEIPVWCNHLDERGVVSLHVSGALAKRDKIMALRRHIHEHDDTSNSSVIVYVGDSSTDLAALLEADVGIIMGQSSSTSMIAQQWGVQILPLKDRSQHGGFGKDNVCGWREKKTLWQVDNWYEIDELLIDLDEHWSK